MIRRRTAVNLAFGLLAGAALAVAASSAFAQSALLGPNLAHAPLEVPSNATLNAALPAPMPDVDTRVAFDVTERWLIPRYFEQVRENQRRAARSKKFPRALPDGLTENPAKGDRLPLAMLPRLERLPGPLQRELTPRRPDTDRVVIGKNVLMVRSSNGEVLDILPNILY